MVRTFLSHAHSLSLAIMRSFSLTVVLAAYVHVIMTAGGVSGTVCDIFADANTPCVAAHSMTRALFGNYTGTLYVVRRFSDMTTAEIGVTKEGYADAKTQDDFCKDTICVVVRVNDQTTLGNHLDVAPGGGAAPFADNGVFAHKSPVKVGGAFSAYGAHFEGGMGYRNEKTNGIAVDDEPETIYMLVRGDIYNGGCCFDYGNAEVDAHDDGKGTMEAVYFGNSTGWGRGADEGPWIMADLENGLWAGDKQTNPENKPIKATFVTAMVKGKSGTFALKGGDANDGDNFKTLYEGPRPPGYEVMTKQGSIILGIGGDNSDRAIGTFYEGVMVSNWTDDATDAAVHANIAAAHYALPSARSQ